MSRIRNQSEDGILGAFQLSGLILAGGLLFEPVREGILLSGAAGIGFATFILLGALVIAVYRFVLMQSHRFFKQRPTNGPDQDARLEWVESAS